MHRSMKRLLAVTGLLAVAVSAQTPRGWTQGKGYGWVYGKDDQLGAVNAINTPGQILAALRDVKSGKVYDLGVRVDRSSFKWPGHSPTEILSFRSPAGVKTLKDISLFANHPKGVAFNSCALFISDNVGTQIDGLGHIVTGQDNHWYNGFRSSEHGTDFGLLRADADSIPPIIARAVLVDVAGWKGVDALPSRFAIGSKELQAALELQKTAIQPGDVVLVRTGTLRYWGETGADHTKLGEHDSAGITLEAAKWLVEQKGASMVGADTSGIEHEGGIAVHEYLLIEQGVHILEFHNLEELARNKVYRFTYVAMTNRLKGTVAGTALRPIALE
ncbi:MAG: cyclase family protein [Bryobacteraceae bacterium]|nr:cyclase family protein [Bryobacteraceae bacterium]